AALTDHPHIRHAAATIHHDTDDHPRIVGYVVADDGTDGAAVRRHVAARLPDYMVPAVVQVLPELPLTPNGKVDRAALPAPDFAALSTRTAPRNATEELLCALFREVLNVPVVGIDDGFFDLGGDSIVAIRLVSRARQEGLALTPRDVFQHKTVAALAQVAKPLDKDADAEAPPGEDGTGDVPLTPVMHWLRERGGAIAGFHQHLLLDVPSGLDRGRLVAGLQAVIDHHDALRARLHREADGGWRLEVPPPGAVEAQQLVAEGGADGDVRGEIAEAVGRLDPDTGRMLSVVWPASGSSDRILLVAHHLVVDAVSWRVLAEDLTEAWRAAALDREPVLPPVGTTVRGWAERLVAQAHSPDRLAELPFWTGLLAGPEPAFADRPLDPARDVAGTARHLTVELPSEHTEAILKEVPAAFRADVADVLLTGLALAVVDRRRRRFEGRGGTALLVEVEGHGREVSDASVDLSRTVGWLTAFHPLRLDLGDLDVGDALDGGPETGTALKRIKEQVRAVPGGGLGYGMLRYLNEETAAALAALPTAQIGFNYLGRLAVGAGGGGALGGGFDDAMPLPHALDVNAVVEDGADGPRLLATFTWPGDLLPEQEVRDLAETWLRALRSVARHVRRSDAGGRTPSDLPLVELDQDQIDELEAAWREHL
ncbi:UNVERIFIED_ORG: non-ribosomal peptide synthase protein (TIGR01720 family), partial [Actinomadura viridilutea]